MGMRLPAWNSLHDSSNTWKFLQSDSSLQAAGDSAPYKTLPPSLRSLVSSPEVLHLGSVDLEAFHSGLQGPQTPQTCKEVRFSGGRSGAFIKFTSRPSSRKPTRPEAERGAGWNQSGLGVLGEPGFVGFPASEGRAIYHRLLLGH